MSTTPAFAQLQLARRAQAQKLLGFAPRKYGVTHCGHRAADRTWFCGAVWTCPICSARLNAERRAQIRRATDALVSSGGALLVATFTVPHTGGDLITELFTKFRQAKRTYLAGRRVRAFEEDYGILGSISILGVTHGRRGFHPYEHTLFFLGREISAAARESFRADMSTQWCSACARVGIPTPHAEHGVHLEPAVDAETVLGNWDRFSKLVRQEDSPHPLGLTPFQLLDASMAGDVRAGRRFRAYAGATFGAKQLRFSRKLLKWLSAHDVGIENNVASS